MSALQPIATPLEAGQEPEPSDGKQHFVPCTKCHRSPPQLHACAQVRMWIPKSCLATYFSPMKCLSVKYCSREVSPVSHFVVDN